MSDPDDPVPTESALDDVREAAGAVLAALRQLIDAAERIVEDPDAFTEAVAGGRAFVEGFVGGFAAEAGSAADGGDPVHES